MTREEFDKLVWDSYRKHGWPMDPDIFAEEILKRLGIKVGREQD